MRRNKSKIEPEAGAARPCGIDRVHRRTYVGQRPTPNAFEVARTKANKSPLQDSADSFVISAAPAFAPKLAVPSATPRRRPRRVDPPVPSNPRRRLARHLALLAQRHHGGPSNRARVHLEEFTEVCPRIAATEAVSAKRDITSALRDIGANAVCDQAYVIGSGHDRALSVDE